MGGSLGWGLEQPGYTVGAISVNPHVVGYSHVIGGYHGYIHHIGSIIRSITQRMLACTVWDPRSQRSFNDDMSSETVSFVDLYRRWITLVNAIVTLLRASHIVRRLTSSITLLGWGKREDEWKGSRATNAVSCEEHRIHSSDRTRGKLSSDLGGAISAQKLMERLGRMR